MSDQFQDQFLQFNQDFQPQPDQFQQPQYQNYEYNQYQPPLQQYHSPPQVGLDDVQQQVANGPWKPSYDFGGSWQPVDAQYDFNQQYPQNQGFPGQNVPQYPGHFDQNQGYFIPQPPNDPYQPQPGDQFINSGFDYFPPEQENYFPPAQDSPNLPNSPCNPTTKIFYPPVQQQVDPCYNDCPPCYDYGCQDPQPCFDCLPCNPDPCQPNFPCQPIES